MSVTKKSDLYKEHRAEYVTPKAPTLVNVNPAKYLAITGEGAPASPEFQNKVGALYGVAFTIKITKKSAGRDYKVCHLEGLWWVPGKERNIVNIAPDEWNWKLLIRVPEFVKEKDLKDAGKSLKARGKEGAAAKVKLETINEGQCVQMLHIGPYSEEKKTVDQMLAFAHQRGLSFRGRRHEIYLSDPRRVPPERLRTILRMPVR